MRVKRAALPARKKPPPSAAAATAAAMKKEKQKGGAAPAVGAAGGSGPPSPVGRRAAIWEAVAVDSEGKRRPLAFTLGHGGRPLVLRTQWRDFGFFASASKEQINSAVGSAQRAKARSCGRMPVCLSSRRRAPQRLWESSPQRRLGLPSLQHDALRRTLNPRVWLWQGCEPFRAVSPSELRSLRAIGACAKQQPVRVRSLFDPARLPLCSEDR